ncbi:hypothetical protein Ciccas_001593 [Cichlidogyrus casuarinus]|uniref:Uncharacterized protein n=1 Tax=Cichlidogyrus casuarinus TaxID=1844966 RepID=A0ABD2QJX3_9PLAT
MEDNETDLFGGCFASILAVKDGLLGVGNDGIVRYIQMSQMNSKQTKAHTRSVIDQMAISKVIRILIISDYYESPSRILNIKISANYSKLACGLDSGQILLFKHTNKAGWGKKLELKSTNRPQVGIAFIQNLSATYVVVRTH